MKNQWVGALAIIMCAMSSSAYPQSKATPLPIEYFTKADEFIGAKISPDGQSLALSAVQKGNSVLAFIDLNGNKVTGALGAGDQFDVLDFSWASNNRLVYSLVEHVVEANTPTQTGELFAVDRDAKNRAIVYGIRAGASSRGMETGTHMKGAEATYASASVVSTLSKDDKKILIAEMPWRKGATWYEYDPDAKPTLTLLDVQSGTKKKLGLVPLRGADVVVDNDDQPRFATGRNEKLKLAVAWKPTPTSDWKSFDLPGFRDESVNPIVFGDDNDTVYLTAVAEKERYRALFRLNLKTQAIEMVYAFPDCDVIGPMLDLTDRKVVGVFGYTDRPVYHWLDEKDPTAKVVSALTRAFPQQRLSITSKSEDGRKLTLRVSSDTNPGDFYVFDTQTMKADHIKSSRSWIDPQRMQPKEPYAFKARDGLELHGYLTRPVGKPPYPLVVLPHGGPISRNGDGFDSEVQLLANRGYAVLQINFRGSSGYGMDFEAAGYREWGGKIQDDITDATHWAVEQKIATADRICIFGTSFGGYSALMGAVREPKLYKCAIGHAGVYDLELMYSAGDVREYKSGREYLERALGKDSEQLHARSPTYNADKIEIPVLLIHGKEDWRADFGHAKRMRAALEKNNKPYEWIALGREGHGIYDEETKRDVYERVLAFLDTHLGVKRE